MDFMKEFLIQMAPQLMLMAFAVVYLVVWSTWRKIVDIFRLRKAQKMWNEYSKNLTLRERMDCYGEWCREHRIENGYPFCYFPAQNKQQVIIYEASIDGNYYRGTMEELSAKIGVPVSFCERMFNTIFICDYSSEDIKKLIKNNV